MIRWSKKNIAKQLAWSDVCYRKAILHHYGEYLDSEEKKMPMMTVKHLLNERLGIEKTAPEVNETYLKELCKLDTNKIELIVEAYNKKKQWRSASTIDVLLSELFERATNPEKRKKYEKHR